MFQSGLRLASQRTKIAANLVHNVRSVRKYSIKVKHLAPISNHGLCALDKPNVLSSSAGGTRCYGGDCSVNKFDKTCIDPSLVASYDEIVDLPNHPEKLLIDVREPAELVATGAIPTSINIPLKTVAEELKLSPEAFQTKYGRKKPEVNDPVIFSCRSGVRAGMAANEADKLGFKNVKNYVGSWLEYSEKNGLPQE